MDKLLDQKLCEDFPEIFKNRRGDMRVTAMCWGFECSDGWFPLIDHLCSMLTSKVRQLRRDIAHMEETLAEADKSKWQEWQYKAYNQEKLDAKKVELDEAITQVPVALQVKEKFGGLRYYFDTLTDNRKEMQDVVNVYEKASFEIPYRH